MQNQYIQSLNYKMKYKFVFTSLKYALLLLIFFLSNVTVSSATIANYTGVYQYNKGLNKANAALYVLQFTEDSAFFYLNGISGMPDFFTTEIRGFLKIDGLNGTFTSKDSCQLALEFKNGQVNITQDLNCKLDFPVNGKYKKTSNTAKKNSTFLISYTEKPAILKSDSVHCYEAPSYGSNIIFTVTKNSNIKIIDEYRDFYLIEDKSKASQFLWIPKSSLSAARKK